MTTLEGAWQDSDDEKVCASLQSKSMLKKLRKNEDEDMISNSSDEPPEESKIRNEPDKHNESNKIKTMTYSQSVIQNVAFHPNAQVAMTAGLDKTIRLFQIDDKINTKIQSVQHSIQNGTEIISARWKKYFYSFNIEAGSIDKSNGIYGFQDKSLENFSISLCVQYIVFAGNSGYLVLVNNRTKQWKVNMKMNYTVTSVDWSNGGRYLYSVGSDAEIYQWMLIREDVFIDLGTMMNLSRRRYKFRRMVITLLLG
ncbi:38170_t:CDS:2 [Gigaspora margarita]|uniref:38170_t:CDS:1 n=1 Tax=Gigaspora margarita TaxID=4874 RepID=A0ABM8W2I3_GIGMA|nr:38170_t:CDS:2 [Gigaspora margarita]